MRTSRVATVTDFTDHLAGGDLLAFGDVVGIVVAILQEIAVIGLDANPLPITGSGAGGHDRAGLGCIQGCADRRSDVGAIVVSAPPRAEARGDRSISRPVSLAGDRKRRRRRLSSIESERLAQPGGLTCIMADGVSY